MKTNIDQSKDDGVVEVTWKRNRKIIRDRKIIREKTREKDTEAVELSEALKCHKKNIKISGHR